MESPSVRAVTRTQLRAVIGGAGFILFGGPTIVALLVPWLLTRWEADGLVRWEVPIRPMEQANQPGRPKDSAVVMYWLPRELKPGEKREVGFSYGLGHVSSSGGQLGLSVGGSKSPGGELTVVALVNNPQPGQKLQLKLPDGFTLVEGQAEQTLG